jgi:hypothetical protein
LERYDTTDCVINDNNSTFLEYDDKSGGDNEVCVYNKGGDNEVCVYNKGGEVCLIDD